MKRKDFIKTCSLACVGATAVGTLLQSCVTTKSINVNIDGDQIILSQSDFIKKEKQVDYIIINNAQLQFPIYVYKFSNTVYKALYLNS